MQLMEIEATQLNKSQSSGQFDARPRSVEVTQEYRANIEIQTDESFLRNCKSAADIGSFVPRKIREKTLRPVDSKEAIEELINDEEQMAHLVRWFPVSKMGWKLRNLCRFPHLDNSIS